MHHRAVIAQVASGAIAVLGHDDAACDVSGLVGGEVLDHGKRAKLDVVALNNDVEYWTGSTHDRLPELLGGPLEALVQRLGLHTQDARDTAPGAEEVSDHVDSESGHSTAD